MNQQIIKFLANIFRVVPHFKGKYRLGMFLQKILNNSNSWKEPEFFIKFKNHTSLFIDVRSKTHSVPFWTGKRDEKIILLIQKLIQPDAVIFDVGANIGYYAIPLAYHLKKINVIVHAFEPVTSNFNSLSKAIKKNKLEDSIVANKFALGNFNGTIDIIKTEKGNTGNAVLAFNDTDFENNKEKETIPIILLDKYMEDKALSRCDFIKIDIEGAEIFFIQGGMKLIEKFKPIIYGEFNSYFIAKFGFTIMDVWDLLEPLGYSVFEEDTKTKASFNETTLKIGMVNLLFIPKERKNEVSKWLNK
jgi:FkbM family methyltransferase